MYDYFATHALVPDRLVSQIQKYCDFSPKAGNQSSKCYAAVEAVYLNIDNINIYNIYAPLCFSTNVTTRPKKASVSDSFSLLINKYQRSRRDIKYIYIDLGETLSIYIYMRFTEVIKF
jgi:hypothetical protein